MAVEALTGGFLEINSVSFGDHTTEVDVELAYPEQDITTFGGGGGPEHGKGLEASMLNFTVLNDDAASSINATMRPLVGTTTTFTARRSSGTVTATNPQYSGTVYVNSWNPLSGAVGEFQRISVSYPVQGTMTIATA